MTARALGLCALALTVLLGGVTTASPQPDPRAEGVRATPARFALVIGVNRSVDADAPALRYADDDAAKYQELFRGLGARTYLVARLDANTERLHGQARAEAHEPKRDELRRVLEQLQSDVRLARERHVRTIVYVVYCGHGDVDDGRGYLALEDARLFGSDLDELIFDRVDASEYHMIVDACYSNLLASARGPGGRRHDVQNFTGHTGIRPRANLGLLFSTSSARQSHEWEGVEGGVFSHEVRSGLYGAADADGDGRISYSEIAAFVDRANAAIPGERFRPDVYARPPEGEPTLVDLRSVASHRIEIDRTQHSHYRLENSLGVQIAEFHNGADQGVTLIEPGQMLPLYLRRIEDETEFAIPLGPAVVRVAELRRAPSAVVLRGAAAHAFGRLFSLPFGPSFVREIAPSALTDVASSGASGRVPLGWAFVAAGAVGVSLGIAALVSAEQARASLASGTSEAEAAEIDRTLSTRRWESIAAFGVGAAAAATGVTLLLWPSHSRQLQIRPAVRGLAITGNF